MIPSIGISDEQTYYIDIFIHAKDNSELRQMSVVEVLTFLTTLGMNEKLRHSSTCLPLCGSMCKSMYTHIQEEKKINIEGLKHFASLTH